MNNENLSSLKTDGSSKIYRRETIDSLEPAQDKSLTYWLAAARKVFSSQPHINLVEVCTDGKKTTSQIIGKRGSKQPKGVAVLVASTGGKWGKSRRDFISLS